MRVFDFDNTIYKGESSFDFAMFVVKRKKTLIRYIPAFLKMLFLYKRCKMDIETFTKQLEKYATPFFKNLDIIQELVDEFWTENIGKLYPEMLKKITKEDIIITSSPDFLLNEIKDVLNTNQILTTELDLKKKKIKFLNFQENKVKALKENYPKKKIKELYTDSYNDKPLMDLAENVYLVKNGICNKIK